MKLDRAKKAAAERAVSEVRQGMLVGLGTGSTAAYAIEALAQKVTEGLQIRGVPTSKETERLARKLGLQVTMEFDTIDVTIDGADEVDVAGNLIKGGGGALTREKIVAAASDREVIVVDESKLVERLGRFPLPVEVVRFGWQVARKRLEKLGCEAKLRTTADGRPFVTDNENYIVDCTFGEIAEPDRMQAEINLIPGVVENGLFVSLTSLVVVGSNDGSTRLISFDS